MYVLRGITLALAWFLVINAGLSLIVSLAAARIPRNAPLLLASRLLPAGLSAAFTAALFIPSYWRYEPRDLLEGFDLTLTTLAAIAVVLLVVAFGCAAWAWWATARRTRRWIRAAEPLRLSCVKLPILRTDASQPVLALVGVLRPRLIATRGLVAALTPDELAASIAHEMGHCRANDNLKRLVMRASPDLLRWLPAGRLIERRWAAAAERDADQAEGLSESRARVALASALVKIARLMPPSASTAPISTLVGGGDIAGRVEQLLLPPRSATRRSVSLLWIGGAALAVACAAGYSPLLEEIHRLTEIAVLRLP